MIQTNKWFSFFKKDKPFDPSFINGCLNWYRADRNVVVSSGKVSHWNPLFGTSSLANTASLNQPNYYSENPLFGNRPTIEFNNTSLLTCSYGVNECTICVVGQGKNPGGGYQSAFLSFVSGNAVNTGIAIFHEATLMTFRRGAGANDLDYTRPLGSYAEIYIGTFELSSAKGYINSNNSPLSSSAPSAVTWYNKTTQFLVGALSKTLPAAAGTYPLSGSIAEIVVYDRILNQKEIEKLNNYFTNEYRITFE